MSRYCGAMATDAILEAAQHWRRRALERDGAVFSDASLWQLQHIEALETYFVKRLDAGEGDFFDKLETQLAPTAPEVKQLAAEMLWVMLLCLSKVTAAKKREIVTRIWGWSGNSLDDSSEWLTDDVLVGIGGAGLAFNTKRWRELAFFVEFLLAFKRLSNDKRQSLLADDWGFARWLESVPGAESRQFRHMMLFLLFPDHFERVFSGNDRRRIATALSGRDPKEIQQMSPVALDHLLFQLRSEHAEKEGTDQLDFYEPPLEALWRKGSFSDQTSEIKKRHVLDALADIDANGVPADAQSTFYDLIYAGRRYPPKYVLAIASREASGEELDRAQFTGGETSQAFRLLRELGFPIERKDRVPELLKQFLAQADEGSSLVTKGVGYPEDYCGLHVKVSFGQGGVAKVPWISFTAFGQSTQKGIYPCYLYFKDAGVLMLTYCISETQPPDRQWPLASQTETVANFLAHEFDAPAPRYGTSFVAASYPVDAPLDPLRVNEDLDRVIATFQQVFSDRIEDGGDAVYAIEDTMTDVTNYPHNLIYFGPPGTGKTYTTIETAVAICDGHVPTDRSAVVARYKALEEKQRIAFVTFHQSYSYEDFVEGIRPVMESESSEGEATADGIRYECRPGVLRTLCKLAKASGGTRRVGHKIDFATAKIWKMSLGDTQSQSDSHLYDQCIEQGEIRLGYGKGLDFTGRNSREAVADRLREVDPDINANDYNITSVHRFKNAMAVGDLVVVSEGNLLFRAIGRVTGAYRFEVEGDYQQVRPVEWLATYDESLPYEQILRKRFSQMTLYRIGSHVLRAEALQELLTKDQSGEPENHVLIIDEINRGNIAKIFGELISLIETDKRLGMANELTAFLPYSLERFGIPKNLYVIGTMNTADRSIALLDTALRRRFEFRELMPDAGLVPGADGTGFISDHEGGQINLRAMLAAINARIGFLLNRDQMIGHAYLMSVASLEDLQRVMSQQIIPLLQEYFYEDWRRIQLVLRDVTPDGGKREPQLVRHEKVSELDILGFDHDDYEDGIEYSVAPEREMTADSFRKIYES